MRSLTRNPKVSYTARAGDRAADETAEQSADDDAVVLRVVRAPASPPTATLSLSPIDGAGFSHERSRRHRRRESDKTRGRDRKRKVLTFRI